MPRSHWPTDPESLEFIDANWDPNVGDARQELVLIGVDMDERAMRQRLDACLLSDAEMAEGPQAWTSFADPFPAWGGRMPDEATRNFFGGRRTKDTPWCRRSGPLSARRSDSRVE